MNWVQRGFLWATGRGDEVADYDAQIAKMMRVRRLAARLWVEAGGHVPYGSDAVHAFMVSYPPTRQKFERLAEAQVK